MNKKHEIKLPPDEAKAMHKARMALRREVQKARNRKGATPMTKSLAYSLAAIREANARNGVGRPPRNKIWLKPAR